MIISDVLARQSYQAYGDTVSWKNFRGDPMPKFDDLPEPIRLAWRAAAMAAATGVRRAREVFEEDLKDQMRAALLDKDYMAIREVSGPSAGHGPETDCG